MASDLVSTLNDIPPEGSTRVNWGWIGSALLGLISTSIFGGVADIVRSLFRQLLIRPITGVTGFVSDQLGLLLGTPAAAISGAWSGTTGFVESLGGLGFLAAIGLVVAAAYLWREVVSRV